MTSLRACFGLVLDPSGAAEELLNLRGLLGYRLHTCTAMPLLAKGFAAGSGLAGGKTAVFHLVASLDHLADVSLVV